MIKIKEVVIVEGKYDKIRLSSLIDGLIIETDGFNIFNNKQKIQLIKSLAKQRGILVLTDSDAAGFKIRGFLNGLVPKEHIKNAFIPDVLGKEKRKQFKSKEGKLGVEGQKTEALIEALKKSGVMPIQANEKQQITKSDLYELGLAGKNDSSLLRNFLKKRLELPSRLSTNMLLDVLNISLDYEQLEKIVAELKSEEEI